MWLAAGLAVVWLHEIGGRPGLYGHIWGFFPTNNSEQTYIHFKCNTQIQWNKFVRFLFGSTRQQTTISKKLAGWCGYKVMFTMFDTMTTFEILSTRSSVTDQKCLTLRLSGLKRSKLSCYLSMLPTFLRPHQLKKKNEVFLRY